MIISRVFSTDHCESSLKSLMHCTPICCCSFVKLLSFFGLKHANRRFSGRCCRTVLSRSTRGAAPGSPVSVARHGLRWCFMFGWRSHVVTAGVNATSPNSNMFTVLTYSMRGKWCHANMVPELQLQGLFLFSGNVFLVFKFFF